MDASFNQQQHTPPAGKRLRLLCGLVVAGVLFCTLWPLNPLPRNQVRWLPPGKGIQFGHHAVIKSIAPLAAAADGDRFGAVELLLQPAETKRVYTILNFYTPENPNQFQVSQWTDGLLVSRDVFRGGLKVAWVKFDVDHAFRAGQPVLLTIVSGHSGTLVYLNGRQALAPRFTFAKSDLSGQLILGTSAASYDPWPGQIRSLTLYSRELTAAEVQQHYREWINLDRASSHGPGDHGSPDSGSPDSSSPDRYSIDDLQGVMARYRFWEASGRLIHNDVASSPNLEIPRFFRVPYKPLLQTPDKEFEPNRRYVKDVLANIAGFVPVGFLFCAYASLRRSRSRAILYSVLAGAAFSFIIENLQLFIPRRASGVTDILTNTLGTLLGACLATPRLVAIVGQAIDHAGAGTASRQQPVR